jgi:hypothetical protein
MYEIIVHMKYPPSLKTRAPTDTELDIEFGKMVKHVRQNYLNEVFHIP